jgi:replicative DNA helicase
LHNHDKVIPTCSSQLNKIIDGGFHNKSLLLFMAECVDDRTLVTVRYRIFYIEHWIKKTLPLKNVKNMLKDHIVEVLSPDGWVAIVKYIEKGKKTAWHLQIDNKFILSSQNHLYETNNGWKFAKDLNCKIDQILTENGYKTFKINKTKQKINVVDISVDHPNHRYYTDGVSSHNTNLGKSLIMTSMAVDCVLRNKNVLYITCEMSEEKISERIMTNMFDICSDDLKLLTRSKFHEKFEKLQNQVKHKLLIKEYPPKAINTNHIRNLIKELQVRVKFNPEIIYIDYLGIMNPAFRNKGDNTYLEVKRISEEVRALAVELNLPIISAVQVGRQGFGDSEIDLTDISESIGTASTADIIIGVTQSDEMRKLGKYCWIILKNRYGLNKQKLNVNVDYYKMRVYEDPDTTVNGTAASITKDIPMSDKDKKQAVNETVADVKNFLNKDITTKLNNMFGKYDNIQ